jgi:hypothetical protein
MLNEHKNNQIKSHVSFPNFYQFPRFTIIIHNLSLENIRNVNILQPISIQFPSVLSIIESFRSSEAKALAFFGAPTRGVHGTQAVEGSSHLES